MPEAQLDRFLLRTAFGYPGREEEAEILGRRIARQVDDVELAPLIDRETLLEMQRSIEQVHVADSVRGYCVDIVAATRESQSTAVGASPRGSLALLKLARCRAALAGRDFVLPDDVKESRSPHSPTGSSSGRSSGSSGSRQRTSSATCSPSSPRRAPRTSGPRRQREANRQPASSGTRCSPQSARRRAGAARLPGRHRAPSPRARGRDEARQDLVQLGFFEADRTLEGSAVAAELILRAQGAVDRLELLLDLPDEVEVVDDREALAVRLHAGEERAIPLSLRCTRWGLHDIGEIELRARPVPPRRPGAAGPPSSPPEGVPHAESLRGSSPGRDAGVHGERGRAGQGRRDRVRRHPRLRPGRPPALHQLARLGEDRASSSTSATPSGTRTSCSSWTASRTSAARTGARSTTQSVRLRRSRSATSSAATGSDWSRSGASCAGSGPGWAEQRYRLIETLLETGVEPRVHVARRQRPPRRRSSRRSLVVALTPRRSALRERARGPRARSFDLVVVEIDPVYPLRSRPHSSRGPRVPPLAPRAGGAPLSAGRARHRDRTVGGSGLARGRAGGEDIPALREPRARGPGGRCARLRRARSRSLARASDLLLEVGVRVAVVAVVTLLAALVLGWPPLVPSLLLLPAACTAPSWQSTTPPSTPPARSSRPACT